MFRYGCHHMSAPLSRVMMRRPGDNLRKADPAAWNYNHLFDPGRAMAEYRQLVDIVQDFGAEIIWADADGDDSADGMFVKDASTVTRSGAILFSMGKGLRGGEPATHEKAYRDADIPILGRVNGQGRIEGGDLIWLDEKTLAVGVGFRSNREGVRQMSALLHPRGVEVFGFDLPYWRGEAFCLHLTSFMSPLNEKTYIAYMPLMPAGFWLLLKERGVAVINSPETEFHDSHGQNVNVLPLSETECVMIDGFPRTRAAIEAAGVSVRAFSGDALCMACEGGPTCLTNPIYRNV